MLQIKLKAAGNVNDAAKSIDTPFNGTWTRKELKKHFYGLDAAYHAKYVKYQN